MLAVGRPVPGERRVHATFRADWREATLLPHRASSVTISPRSGFFRRYFLVFPQLSRIPGPPTISPMQSIPDTISSRDETNDPLKVLVIYDEFSSGLRAMRIYQRQVAPLTSTGLKLDLWKVEPLGIEEIRAAAALQACEADLIFISLRGDADLSPEITRWIEEWRHFKISPTGLALLLSPEH